MPYTEKSICEQVREAEQNYVNGTTALSHYVNWSMYDTIERIDAYANSKHISGEKDSLDRDKPFFNIVTAAMNIWYRATDLDRKDIRILSSKESDVAVAFAATQLLQQWMRDARFGVFLNEWGRTLAKYGSAVTKFVEKNGELTASVVSWNRFIADPIDFDAIPKIEKLYLTEAQLHRLVDEAGYDQAQVEALCDAAKGARENLDKQVQDNQDNFIELYEVHGEFSAAVYKAAKGQEVKEEDDDTYFQQMHVVSFVAEGTQDGETEYQDFTLFSGRETKNPYLLTHLIKEDGRTLGIGSVEYLFDAQWMQNHSIKNQKDVLDLSSKLIFQTADASYVGRNVLSAIESGDIMVHKPEMPLTQINNSKADIVALQNFGTQWQILAQQLTNTPDLTRGISQAQPLTYGLGQILNENSNSLFEIMTENKGLAVEDMAREFIVPHLMKKLDSKAEIVAILDDNGIAEMDALFLPSRAVKRFNKRTTSMMLDPNMFDKGAIPSPFNPQVEQQALKQDMAPLGNKRFLKPEDIDAKTWKAGLKGFDMRVVVEVTNESSDKQAVLQTLSTVLQTLGSNPQLLQDPNAKMVFSKILEETAVVSPLQISTSVNTPPPPPAPAPNSSPPVGAAPLPAK